MGKNAIKCDHCDEVFEQNHELENHMRSLQLEKQFKCEKCPQELFLEWRMKKHAKGHNGQVLRKCHFFNNNKCCPYELIGFKFLHQTSENCRFQNT